MNEINIDKEEDVKRAKKMVLIIISLFPLFLIALISYGVYWACFDMNRLPKQVLISEVKSPDGAYTVKAYLSNGGATTSFAVLGELNYNKVAKKPKNIYWNYREDHADIKWIDNDTVIINGQKLDVPYQSFDFRKKVFPRQLF
ncbi:DUF5412 domain-containing protein [Desulforamulus aquiferis]|uniref:DUF5412 domain-containing protein n=1 Tax=Desulforamulus aquiferis TaxID=1397668 RepID=A0AAW7ZFW1_9FIRM|nr:DUF5412 domain-containing protein [Desulforamulus aquiferis]MDO7788167.1 DUF5412 domain-containing protein [Desulforamulus aquiferis]